MANNTQGLPNWAKGTVAIIVTVGAVVGIYYSVKGIKKYIDKQGFRKEVDTAKTELADLNKNPATKQTITDSQAESFATTLYSAMDGNGTDEDAIMIVFRKLKRDSDVLAVIKAYGTRKLHGELLWETVTYEGSLAGALTNELDTYWINKINTILANNKVKYRF